MNQSQVHNNVTVLETTNPSRSPTVQRKYINQPFQQGSDVHFKLTSNSAIQVTPQNSSPNLNRRSLSPSPRRLLDIKKKQLSLDSSNSVHKFSPSCSNEHTQLVETSNNVSNSGVSTLPVSSKASANEGNSNSNKFENVSDNGSEISDEGYRSLGLIQANGHKRESLHSQTSAEDAINNGKF